jgi:hypothetical protein
MSDKEARVRLTLNSGSFLGGMQQLSGDVQRISKTMESAMQTPFNGGLKAAKESFGKIRGEIGTIAKMGIGLGGGFEVASAVKGALEMSGQYKSLAFRIEAATGKAIKAKEIQEEIETTAMKWSRANSEVDDSLKELFTRTGNYAFAAEAVQSVAMAAQAGKEPMEAFTGIAAQLNKVFGITAEQMPAALASVTSLAGKGADLGELAGMFERAGASAKVLGMQGSEGLARFSAMLNLSAGSGATMRQRVTGLNQIMMELSSPEAMKGFEKKLHESLHKTVHLVSKRGVIADNALERIMRATGGDSGKLQEIFKGTGSASLMGGLGKVYKETGGGQAFEDAIQKLGASSLTASRMEKEAAANNSKASAEMKRAMNELENEFSKPEMLKALKEMAHIMPKVAHGAAQLLEMVVNHPLLGGGAVIGGKIALDAAGGFGSTLMAGLGKKIVAEVMAQKLTVVAKPIVDGLGMTIGKEFVTVAAAATPWQNAGKLLAQTAGVAIAAYVAYEAGKWLIDKAMESKADDQRTAAVGVAVSGTGDKKQIEPALKKAREALKVAEAEARATSHMGVGGMGAGMTPGGGEVIETKEVKLLRGTVRELEEALRGLSRTSKDASGELNKVKSAAGAASNGLPKPGANEPGAG